MTKRNWQLIFLIWINYNIFYRKSDSNLKHTHVYRMKKVKTISVENYQAILCVFKGFKGFICVQFYDVRWTGVVMTSKICTFLAHLYKWCYLEWSVTGLSWEVSCNNVAPVTNLCLGRATTRSHSSQWSKKKVAVET
jgi:hypothetical protein